MKAFLAIAALLFCTVAYSQDPLKTNTLSDTSSFYIVKLIDNTMLTGKILEKSSESVTFFDISIGKVTIAMNKISSMVKQSGNLECILTTNDGKVFSGVLLSQDEEKVVLLTGSLGEISILNGKIKEIQIVEKEHIINGQYFFPNPHPTRTFFAPTAIPLKKGEGYFQNAWIAANSVQVGITDNFSMGGGMVIPILFFFTPKIGFKVAENVHIGGGIIFASTLSSDFGFGVGAAYGSLTLGNYEHNFTVNAGWGAFKQEEYDNYPYQSKMKWTVSDRPLFTFSGMTRIARKFALITENWVFATKETIYTYSGYPTKTESPYHSVLSGGFRFLGEKNSFDFGLALPLFGGETFGIPYLDYVFKF